MTGSVLDASALLAFLQDEPGADLVDTVLADSCISAVNWSEVVQKALVAGVDVQGLKSDILALGLDILDFTDQQAEIAATLWVDGKKVGLSLGDRACLALADFLGLPVLTADRAWSKLAVPMKVTVLR